MTEARKFTCAACGETFTPSWTDEEAQREADKNFPGLKPEDRSTVCDDCYKLLLQLYGPWQ